MTSPIYYLVEHTEDEPEQERDKAVVARFDRRITPYKRALELWQIDKRNWLRDNGEGYLDACEEETWEDDRLTLDFRICAIPGHVWVAEIIESKIPETDKDDKSA